MTFCYKHDEGVSQTDENPIFRSLHIFVLQFTTTILFQKIIMYFFIFLLTAGSLQEQMCNRFDNPI